MLLKSWGISILIISLVALTAITALLLAWLGVNPLNNPDIETIRKEEREKILEIINWHRATAKQEYEKGIERDGDRWVGSNCTDYPHGKVDALDSLKKELLQKVKK